MKVFSNTSSARNIEPKYNSPSNTSDCAPKETLAAADSAKVTIAKAISISSVENPRKNFSLLFNVLSNFIYRSNHRNSDKSHNHTHYNHQYRLKRASEFFNNFINLPLKIF